VVARGSCGPFAVRVRTVTDGNPTLEAIVEPLLAAWQTLREQTAVLDRQALLRAKADRTARRLMSIPTVGVIVALAYVAVIDTPERFKRSSSVGASRSAQDTARH
jgi:transposase